jgi:hypothetical protein
MKLQYHRIRDTTYWYILPTFVVGILGTSAFKLYDEEIWLEVGFMFLKARYFIRLQIHQRRHRSKP